MKLQPVPSYEQLEKELAPYRVTVLSREGKPFQYLSVEKKHEYLKDKGVIKIVRGDVVILQDSLTGAIPYVEYMNRIDVLNYKKDYKKLGSMGVKSDIKTNVVKEINADEIPL